METVLLQINNVKAYKLLEDMEELNVIKVLEKKTHIAQKLSEKYGGKLPAEIADELQNYIAESRNEWSKRI